MSTRGRWVCSRCGGMKDAKGACPVCDVDPKAVVDAPAAVRAR